jgi:hypothetical protein
MMCEKFLERYRDLGMVDRPAKQNFQKYFRIHKHPLGRRSIAATDVST